MRHINLQLKALLPVAWVVTTSAFASTVAAQGNRSSAESQARDLSERYVKAFRDRYPEAGSEQPISRLFDNSRPAYARWAQTEAQFLSGVSTVAARVSATSSDAVTLAMLRERLEASRKFEVCHRELWNVSPVTGWLSEYRGYAAQQSVGNQAKRAAALRRWRQLPSFIDTEIANLQFGQRRGFSAPRILVSGTIAQLDLVLAAPTRESPFYAPARNDTNTVFRNSFESLVRDAIVPAIRRYREFLARDYLPRARETVGVSDNPGGSDCFRALIRRYTSLPLTPGELDWAGRDLLRRGLAERSRTRVGQGKRVSAQTSRSDLVADSANSFRSALEVMQYADEAMRRAWAVAPQWFGRLPSVPLPLIDSLPGADDSDPSAQYIPGSHGNAPSQVLLNLPSLLKPGGKFWVERLIFHESVPGHHLQIALQQSAAVNPLNRMLWNAAFAEGWAVYASNLADEMGLYSSEPSRFRLIESVVDDGLTFVVQSGLHAHGWSRAQAVDTMVAYSSDSRAELEQQVDYYIAAPGHALAYPVGAREIDRLRREARLKLGSRFDVRRFHDAVLANGPVPLTTLRAIIAQWIERER